MGPTPRKGAGWCALFLIALPAFSAEWYETTPFRANDPFQFDSQRSVLFPNTGLTLAGHPATGLLYATLPPATMAEPTAVYPVGPQPEKSQATPSGK